MKRYVLIYSVNDQYGNDLEMDTLPLAEIAFDELYHKIELRLAEYNHPVVGTITLFDRDADIDIKHVELVRYHREVQG